MRKTLGHALTASGKKRSRLRHGAIEKLAAVGRLHDAHRPARREYDADDQRLGRVTITVRAELLAEIETIMRPDLGRTLPLVCQSG